MAANKGKCFGRQACLPPLLVFFAFHGSKIREHAKAGAHGNLGNARHQRLHDLRSNARAGGIFTGLKIQACAIRSAASSGAKAGTLLYRLVGAIMGVRTYGVSMVAKLMSTSANSLETQRVQALSTALLAT